MKELNIIIKKQLQELNIIEKMNEKKLKNAPEGSLYAIKNKNSLQYYWRKNDGEEIYINKKSREVIKKLAQKEYERNVQKIVKKNKKCLENMLGKYEFDETLKAYEKISDKKKRFVNPYVMPDEMYAKKWYEEQNALKEENMKMVSTQFTFNSEEENAIITEKGEQVRSKSEKIIADKLFMKNIPYVYEQPLYLKGYGYVVPDFKILNVKNRKEFYLEHFGMMDEVEYVKKALSKIETFEKNDIYPGDNLLMTFETSSSPINVRLLDKIVNRYLI